MKTQNFENSFDILEMFVLTDEEMINVRGGDPEGPTNIPTDPPIKI
jgi:hypothetical protein